MSVRGCFNATAQPTSGVPRGLRASSRDWGDLIEACCVYDVSPGGYAMVCGLVFGANLNACLS